MSSDLKSINDKNAYLIGSNPETMKMDIIMFKEEVLVELKQLNNSLAEKYRKISQEVQDKLELFEKKLVDLNIKLSDLSTKIVTDMESQEKLSELLVFKDKAQDIMTSNKIKINMNGEETRRNIDRINSILKESVIYPGVVGNRSRFKCFHEYIDYTLWQITIMNNFREKSILDLSLYKKRIEDLFDSMKLQMNNDIRSVNYFSTDSIKRTEDRLLNELRIRDEKIRDLKVENKENIIELNKEMKIFLDNLNIIKENKKEIDKEIINIKKDTKEITKGYNEKYNNIENQLDKMNITLQSAVNYLNKEGAEIQIFQEDNFHSLKNIHSEKNLLRNEKRKSIIFRNKAHFDFINNNENKDINKFIINNKKKESHFSLKDNELTNKREVQSSKERKVNFNLNKNQKDDDKKGPKLKTKSSKYVSDIMKYIKGQIKADEIGSQTKSHNKEPNEKIDKNEVQENKNHLIERLHKRALTRNKSSTTRNKGGILNLNKALDESFEKNKTEKAIKKNIKAYKHIIKIGLNDVDMKYHGNNISSIFNIDDKNNKAKAKHMNKNKENNNTYNYNNILENQNFNSTKIKNSNIKNIKKNFFQKNLSLVSFDKFDNINLNNNFSQLNYTGSYNNLFRYNNDSLMSLFLPSKNSRKIQLNYNNKTIDSKNYNSSKFKLNKLSNNIYPIDLNNNNSIFQTNSINSFFSFSKDFTNKVKLMNNIKTLFNKRKIFPLYKNYKTK